MKTFIWANDIKSEYYFFVAIAETIEGAKNIILEKINKKLVYYPSRSIIEENEDNSYYYKEWIDYINTKEPIIIENNNGGIFSHYNE